MNNASQGKDAAAQMEAAAVSPVSSSDSRRGCGDGGGVADMDGRVGADGVQGGARERGGAGPHR